LATNKTFQISLSTILHPSPHNSMFLQSFFMGGGGYTRSITKYLQ